MTSTANPADRLIVALDLPTAEQALALAKQLEGTCRWAKVGMELYYAAGPSIVSVLRDRGWNVFLDLKLCDIPNTVASAIRSLSGSGASLLTVHASGGPAMLAAAQEAAAKTSLRLLAVTVLTSMDGRELNAIGLAATPEEQVLRLAHVAATAGISGLVCSPREVSPIRKELGSTPLLVVPGIRSADAPADDQRRTAAPADAIAGGASMLVVGRPITKSADPLAAASGIICQIKSVI